MAINHRQPSSVLAPESLINNDGQPIYGHFDGIVADLGVKQFSYFNDMDKLNSSFAKYVDFKQFQFINITTPRYIIGVAIADIRYVGSSFCYLYDIEKNRLTQTQTLKPLALGMSLSQSPKNGQSRIKHRQSQIEFIIKDGVWQLNIAADNIQAELTLTAPMLSLPMSLCTPTGYSGWTYTQKHNGLKVSGCLTVNDEPQPLNQALAGYDFSAGYMRRETSWRWASINTQVESGVLGLNLAAGVNETGDTENVLWINGERHLMPAVRFDFNRQLSDDNWYITGGDNQIDLSFRALKCRSEKINLGFLKSNFRQYIGYFSGQITDNNGRVHQLQNQLGLTEDHFAKW
ncbi:DUF2804 domain-containing protein [Shewanella sp. UCD-KL21]|uniref:DUF2804 domain-containing protein n=1 Tax=Shewanella sp. UCD-KL21 TaxID=1917164 RepID=UPI0009705829|nr:DUF2804 domain-containing protein [Shewanella sp. UCD-KL21]